MNSICQLFLPLTFLPPQHGIQIMMGRLSDLSDFGRSFVPYLTWRDERTSLVLLQLSVLSGVFTFLVAPFIPWRFVFIALGEAVLLAGHPIAKTLAGEAAPFLQASGKRFGVRAARLLEDDALLDEELDSEIIELERFEVESRQDGAWAPDVTSGGELPKGFKWLRVGDWVVDELYAGGQVDEGEFGVAVPAPRSHTNAVLSQRQLDSSTCILMEGQGRLCSRQRREGLSRRPGGEG